MGRYDSTPIAKSDRIKRLVDHLYAKMPEIEASRAELITESYPEFSYEWLEAEFETVETRSADPFYISDETKKDYWRQMLIGKEKQRVNLPLLIWHRKHFAQ